MKYCDRRIYEHLERDYDGCDYWFRNKDVVSIQGIDDLDIHIIFKYYESKVDSSSYYVIGNRFYFTYNNVKFYTIISSFEAEVNILDDLIKELTILGCKDFYYNPCQVDKCKCEFILAFKLTWLYNLISITSYV